MGFFDFYPYTNWHNVNLDWVLQRVKEWGRMVEANNQAFQDLEAANASFKAYVENYLQNLDVQDEIDNKLDEMFASGELMEYIEPYINGLAFPEYLPVDVLYNKLNYSAYNVQQGGCSDGQNLYVCYTQPDNDIDITLRKYSLQSFNIITEQVLPINHGNSATYSDGKIYITDIGNMIHVVDAETLTIENSVSLNFIPIGVCIDSEGQLVVLKYSDLSIRIYSLPDFTIIAERPPLVSNLMYDANQWDIEYNNGYYYLLLSGPLCLYIYNDNFELIKVVNINERYERITLKESEFITYTANDNFIIGWNTPLYPSGRLNYPVVIENIFTTSNFTKGNSDKEENITDVYSPNQEPYIYINKAYNGNYSNGNWRYPFKEIQQALNDVNLGEVVYRLALKAGTYYPVYATSKNFAFTVWPNQSTDQSLRNVTIGSVRLISCNAVIDNVRLTSHTGAENYALRLESGSTAWANIATANEYNAYITNNSNLVTNGLNIPVDMASGILSPNSRPLRDTSVVTKRTGNARVLGRVLLHQGSEKTGDIELAAQIKDYVLILITLNVENVQFTGVMTQTGKCHIPILYYSSNVRVDGFFEITYVNDTTITVSLSCYKNNAAYNPNSFNWIADGIL